jgi:hypothetical protein
MVIRTIEYVHFLQKGFEAMGLSDDIALIAMGATRAWKKQRQAEDRNTKGRHSRAQYVYSDRIYHTDVAEEIIALAYDVVSGGGTLPAHCRQLFYRCRPRFLERTGREVNYKYFSQDLVRRFPPDNAWITFDERGTFYEPHTGQSIPLGTLQVDKYVNDNAKHGVTDELPALKLDYPTKGAKNRFAAILFIEKQGFDPLFKKSEIAKKYDLGIMSSKGQSTAAARKLLDHVAGAAGIPILILHDLDSAGFDICNAATRVTDSAAETDRIKYEFLHDLNAIDIGVRLADVEHWGLEPEPCKPPSRDKHIPGATQAEFDFLRQGQRVELNAFSSPDLISHIEAKLVKHGIKKVVPDADILQDAYHRAYRAHQLNSVIREAVAEFDENAGELDVPPQLKPMVTDLLDENPTMSWDEAIAEVAADELGDE